MKLCGDLADTQCSHVHGRGHMTPCWASHAPPQLPLAAAGDIQVKRGSSGNALHPQLPLAAACPTPVTEKGKNDVILRTAEAHF